jgi:hypothetical protein
VVGKQSRLEVKACRSFGAGQDDEMDWSGWAVTRRAGGRDGAYRLDRHLHGANREPQVPWGKLQGCRGVPAADLDWPASIKLPVLGPTELSRQYPVRSPTGEERGQDEYPRPIDAANPRAPFPAAHTSH